MQYVVLGFVLVIATFGVSLALTAALEYSDERQIKEYIDSRGAAPVPFSWRGKIGKGI